MVGRILENRKYLGNEKFPKIIDEEIFNKAQKIRQKRAISLGRTNLVKQVDSLKTPINFKIGKVMKYLPNPYKQAEYIYSLIERIDNER